MEGTALLSKVVQYPMVEDKVTYPPGILSNKDKEGKQKMCSKSNKVFKTEIHSNEKLSKEFH
jgi:hypothetical protein